MAVIDGLRKMPRGPLRAPDRRPLRNKQQSSKPATLIHGKLSYGDRRSSVNLDRRGCAKFTRREHCLSRICQAVKVTNFELPNTRRTERRILTTPGANKRRAMRVGIISVF